MRNNDELISDINKLEGALESKKSQLKFNLEISDSKNILQQLKSVIEPINGLLVEIESNSDKRYSKSNYQKP